MDRNNFIFLFTGLLVLLVAQPIIVIEAPGSRVLLQLAFTLTLILGVWTLHREERWFHIGLGLVVLATVSSGLFAYTRAAAFQLANLAVVGAFCALSIAIAFRQVVLAEGAVTTNRLMGGLCIYLLMGTLWSILYSFLEYFDPAAFAYPAEPGVRVEHFLYYSFVTLTTLGYGDLTPVNPIARTFSYLEAVLGQLYVAVLIAGLVGRYLAEQSARAGQTRREVQ